MSNFHLFLCTSPVTSPAQVLYKSCTSPGKSCSGPWNAARAWQVLHKSCTSPAQVLYKSCTSPVQVLDKSCTNPVQVLYKSCTSPVQVLYTSCTSPVQVLYRSLECCSCLTSPVQGLDKSCASPVASPGSWFMYWRRDMFASGLHDLFVRGAPCIT